MKMIGIGDNVVDRYINKRIMYPGGNAVNFAVYAHQCGEESAYLGVIADDKEGRLVYNSLNKIGVDVSMSYPTIGFTTERCDVELRSGERIFIGSEFGEGEWRPFTIDEKHYEYLRNFDVIHCGCYADMRKEIHKLNKFAAVKTYDFSSEEEYRTDEYLKDVCPYIDIALFSQEEMSDEQVQELQKKAHRLGAEMVLITNGCKGQTLWDKRKSYKGKVKLIDAVDTMGAGDSFFAAFVTSLVRNGYKRGVQMSEEKINTAFEFAADFSAKICLIHGAFGFGEKY